MSERGLEQSSPEVVSAMHGDERARAALWGSHRRWLAAILLSHKPREIDIEDLMQDIAVKFVAKLHTLRDPAAFKPWLRRIAINAAREAARGLKGGRQASIPAEDEVAQHRLSGPLESYGSRDEARVLLAHALTLPLEFREPLMLRCVRGMGCKQIAQLLGLPVTTVETRLSRARRMLREEWMAKTERA